MKILVQHIENLLPEHDCVVVPGLGGFVQNEVRSSVQSDSNLFHPATKEICFNPRLKFNDGLLAQSYQEIFGMSFEEANYQIQQSVQEIFKKLDEGKYVRIGRIGTLTNYDGQLLFRPDHKNHFLPESYGLFTFSFPKLPAPAPIIEAPLSNKELKQLERNQRRQQTFDLKRSNVSFDIEKPAFKVKKTIPIEIENAVLLARALEAHGMGLPQREKRLVTRARKRLSQVMLGLTICLLLLVLVTKPASRFVEKNQQANLMMHQYFGPTPTQGNRNVANEQILIDATLNQKQTEIASIINEAAEALVRPRKVSIENNRIIIQSPESTLIRRLQETLSIHKEPNILPKERDPNYYVILSTFSDKSTAETWLSIHSKEPGIQGATIVNLNGWYRISAKSFKNKVEADRFLGEFALIHPEYTSAWIYNQGK